MKRTDDRTTNIEVNALEIKHAIVKWVKEKYPGLKGITPKISVYMNLDTFDVENAKLKFEHEREDVNPES